MDSPHLSSLAQAVVVSLEKKEHLSSDRKITVNPLVSKIASWYEKLRKAMEYREEEVILRATIERVLRRRLLLGGNGETTAEPLVRELLWARYLEENSVSEPKVSQVSEMIDLYLSLRLGILASHKISQYEIDEWIYHLMSSAVEKLLNPNMEKETVGNFIFQILKDHIEIADETQETKDAQVYIAVRRSFARDDIAFLRYHLFKLYFGELSLETLPRIVAEFPDGYSEIMHQLKYVKRERIYAYVKRKTAPFLILEEVLRRHKDNLGGLLTNSEAFKEAVFSVCEEKYKSISTKVRRAIVRSVMFILLTKVVFAFAIEGTYDRLVYGRILWTSLVINTATPPLLMILVSLFIRTPDAENSRRILATLENVLYEDNPELGNKLMLQKNQVKPKPIIILFDTLWLFAFIISFGGIVYILNLLHFNLISQFIFLFFLAIVSFLTYRINTIAESYIVLEKQNLLTPVIDFLFLPIVRVGRHLTESVSRINFILFIFDFVFETPFKVVFAFFEQWFHFLHAKREELG